MVTISRFLKMCYGLRYFVTTRSRWIRAHTVNHWAIINIIKLVDTNNWTKRLNSHIVTLCLKKRKSGCIEVLKAITHFPQHNKQLHFQFPSKMLFKKTQLKAGNVWSKYWKSYGGCQITKAIWNFKMLAYLFQPKRLNLLTKVSYPKIFHTYLIRLIVLSSREMHLQYQLKS